MSTSLVACGPAAIEVGKYGLSLEEAKMAFLKTVEETGNTVKSLSVVKDGLRISLKWDYKANQTLLLKVADVADLHGDAPDLYFLECKEPLAGEYVRTGSYND